MDSATLALGAIAGAFETGEYLSLDHTVRNFREQFRFPRLMDQRRYGEWAEEGKRTPGERAREVVQRLLDEHRAPPLPVEQTAKLDRIVARQGGRGS
ncbi:unnamed protein product [marine sediment metagenome]|uniref:Trimethylamine methyltransferase n=1 Tax=marine sediment metagenome TaxID=412755 RepID=X1J9B1_9ZZZZ